METNKAHISDTELRRMINQLMLKDHGTSSLTQNLIEMEAQVSLSQKPLYVATAASGAAILAKLNSKILYKVFTKWLLISTGTIGLTTGTIWYATKNNGSNEPQKQVTSFTSTEKQEKPEQESVIEDEQSTVFEETTNKNPNSGDPIQVLPFRQASLENYTPFELIPSAFQKVKKDEKKDQRHFEQVKTIVIHSDNANIKIAGSDVMAHGQVDLDIQFFEEENENVKMELKSNQTGQKLELTVSYENKSKRLKLKNSVKAAELTIVSAPDMNLEIHNSSGNIEVKQLQGEYCKVNNDFGSVKLVELESEKDIRVNSGNLTGNNWKGNATVKCDFGNFDVDGMTGTLDCRVNSGNIKMKKVKSDLKIQNDFGNVSIEDATGEFLKLKVNSGNFNLSQAEFKLNDLNIDFGNLKFEDVSGKLVLKSNSGNVNIRNLKGDASIQNDFGNQEIHGQTGNLDIRTSSGKLDLSDISGDVKIKASYSNVILNGQDGNLEASVESGNFTGNGIKLKEKARLEADNGNINLKTVNKLDDLNCELESNMGSVHVNKNGTKIKKSDGNVSLDKGGKIKLTARANSGNVYLE